MTSESQVSSALRAGMALSRENGGSFVGMYGCLSSVHMQTRSSNVTL